MRHKLIRVLAKTTVLLNRAIRKQNGTEKVLCGVNIQKSVYIFPLPFSQFQVSARAMEAAVAGVSLHGLTEVW